MSYILDALRKSDQQRQRGAMPTLQTAQIAAAQPRQSEHWIYGLIAVVLVGAGIAIGWLHGGEQKPPAIATSPVSGPPITGENAAAKPREPGLRPSTAAAAASAAVAPAPVAASPQADLNLPGTPKAPDERRTRAPETQAAAAPASSGAVMRPDSLPQASARSPENATLSGAIPAAQEPRVMTIGELPDSIQQELPAMQISLHLYSTRPGNSFVSINNQMLQEGANVAPGIKLEKITPDGVVFGYKGYRFRRGVQ